MHHDDDTASLDLGFNAKKAGGRVKNTEEVAEAQKQYDEVVAQKKDSP